MRAPFFFEQMAQPRIFIAACTLNTRCLPSSPCVGQRAAGDAAERLWWGTAADTADTPSSSSRSFSPPHRLLGLSRCHLGRYPHCRQRPNHSNMKTDKRKSVKGFIFTNKQEK